jgi:23S rRNA pseudouridine1911/1915/1917 synthase
VSPRHLDVPETSEEKRVDLFVGEALGLSRKKLKALFDDGKVRVDGRVAKKGQTLRPGQRIEVADEAPSEPLIPEPDAPLTVLHEDDALLFIDKPAGWPSHPLAPNEKGTVANALVARFPECASAGEDPREGGLCHRLDIETSGVLVAARDRESWTRVRQAFSERTVDKHYLALVRGPLADDGEIDLPLKHHPRHPDRVIAAPDDPEAREAISRFKVLGRALDYALVDVQILTGVLHQVRAHLAAIGAPLVGDPLYGGLDEPGLLRFFLHAQKLGVEHPRTGARVVVVSPLPAELEAVLARHGLSTVSSR